MLKYTETEVVFEEVPDEITLAINISGCPCRCPLCHSKHLWNDIGTELTIEELEKLLEKNKGVTCICFMGGDAEPSYVNYLANFIRSTRPNLKIGWYSGRDIKHTDIDEKIIDYIKIGRYDGEFGSLDKETTNQKLFYHGEDITYKFWRKRNK